MMQRVGEVVLHVYKKRALFKMFKELIEDLKKFKKSNNKYMGEKAIEEIDRQIDEYEKSCSNLYNEFYETRDSVIETFLKLKDVVEAPKEVNDAIDGFVKELRKQEMPKYKKG